MIKYNLTTPDLVLMELLIRWKVITFSSQLNQWCYVFDRRFDTFDYQSVISSLLFMSVEQKQPDFHWYKPLKCEDMLLLFAI